MCNPIWKKRIDLIKYFMDWDKFLYNDKFYNDQQAFKKWDK